MDAFSIRITVFIGGKCRGDGFLQTDGLRRFDERIQHRGKYAAGGFVIFNPRLSLYAFSGDTYLYENPWTLPLGFILPDIVETGWKRDLSSPADVQNDLSDVLGVPECLIFTDGEEQGNRFSFTAPRWGVLYKCRKPSD